MPVAELIAIGTEMLLGEIQDTNTRYIARILRDNNIDLFRSSIVGDNAERIASIIQEALSRANIVITTGGLGPTVDDPTREAAANAWNVPLEFHPELWSQIETRFLSRHVQPTENNRRQAYIPSTSTAISNPVGTAPAFILEDDDHCLICLPGVPREMETLIQLSVLPYLKKKFALRGIIKARVIHISGVGESKVDESVAEFESLRNPTVGLLAHPGIVDIRITAKADSEAEADRLISDLERTIQDRFPQDIFGTDDDTLQDVVLRMVQDQPQRIFWLFHGIKPDEFGFSRPLPANLILREVLEPTDRESLLATANQLIQSRQADVVVVSQCFQTDAGFNSFSGIITKTNSVVQEKIYNGPPAHNIGWSVNNNLDFLRRQYRQIIERTD